ncbi:MAG: YkgJ family cysteine cluster protein [Syntrophobacteraceae bacterium]
MKNSADHISDFSTNHPSGWDVEAFRANWHLFFETIVKENSSSLVPQKRILYQIEQTPAFRDITARWDKMDGSQRLDAWKQLLAAADSAAREILPACVQCGECCRVGSPTLHLEDLEILRTGKVPWDRLMTLRRGEPARSPFEDTPFVLPEERIKVREKANSAECVFLNAETDRCEIYNDRPLQCRAQACWDPAPARDLASRPFLLRKHIFEGVDVLLEIIAEHDTRCGFETLTLAFEKLRETNGQSVDEALRLLSYEEHFRQFVAERFNIPPGNMELVFGRSFAGMVNLFGYRVVDEPDGGRCLVTEQ